MQLTNQKRLAAKILGCGENRVWINPDYIDEIASSVQADDIREFIEEGQGKRMGTANARNPRKNRWMRTIRSQRRVLKDLREADEITPSQYRRYYLKAKGGSYRSIAHMRSQMTLEGVQLKEGDN